MRNTALKVNLLLINIFTSLGIIYRVFPGFYNGSVQICVIFLYLLAVLLLISYKIVIKAIPNIRFLSNINKLAILISAVAIYVISLMFCQIDKWGPNIIVAFINYFCVFIYIALIITAFILAILKNEIILTDRILSRKEKYVMFLKWFFLFFSVYFFFYLTFFPGNMTVDSIDQWTQKETNIYTNHHPIFSTLYIKLLTLIWNSPGTVSLFQIVVFSFINAYIFTGLYLRGIKEKLIWLTAIIILLMPLNGFMLITLWKDIPYALVFYLMTYYLFLVFITEGRWLNSLSSKLLLGTCFFAIAVLRHDGIYIYILTSFVIFLLYWKIKRSFFKVFAISLVLVLIFELGVVNLISKAPAPGWMAYTLSIDQVKLLLDKKETIINDEDKSFFRKILPEDHNRVENYYSPYVAAFGSAEPFNSNEFLNNKREFIIKWLKLINNNKKASFEIWKKQTSIIWSIERPKDGYQYAADPGTIIDNKFGLRSSNLMPAVKKFLSKQWLNVLSTDSVNWWFARPAIFNYLSMLFAFILYLRNGIKSIIIATPLLLSICGLLLTVQAQDTRYIYFAFLVAPFLFLISSIKRN